jgi:hypothetical protein
MTRSAPSHSRSTSALTDQEWLRSLAVAMPEPIAWHTALRKGNSTAIAKLLRKRLAPLRSLHLLPSLRWSCDAQADSLTLDVIDELSHLLKRKGRQVVELLSGMMEAWLDRQAASTLPSLLDQLLASLVLVEQADRLSDGVLVRLWRFVEERTGQAGLSRSSTHPAVQELMHLEQQMLRMLAATTQTPSKADLGPVAQGLREFLGQYSDESGVPSAEIHGSLGVASASLIRLQQVAQALEIPLCEKKDQRRLKGLVRRSLLIVPIDCSWFPSRTPHEALDWIKCAAKTFDLRSDDTINRQLRFWANASLGETTHATERKSRRPALKKKQLTSHQSDVSKYAFLHGDWREARDRCLVRFDSPIPQLEASVLEKPLLRGVWSARVIVAGQVWTEGEWTCSCWFSDADADFVELKWEPAAGVTVYRQLLWARKDRFLIVADEVRAPDQHGIQLQSQLPLGTGWTAIADGRTREWQLQQGTDAVRIYPIFQAQQRVQKTDGKLECTSHGIQTHLTAQREGGYSAIVIDWDRSRQNSPVQWSPLTVIEDRQRVAPHVASGARWKLGEDLWMVYHQSSKGETARSILGLHTHHETVITRVKDGNYERLVEVES